MLLLAPNRDYLSVYVNRRVARLSRLCCTILITGAGKILLLWPSQGLDNNNKEDCERLKWDGLRTNRVVSVNENVVN